MKKHSNLYVALEDIEHNPGFTVYTFAVHQGRREDARRFKVARNQYGEIKLDKVPEPLHGLLRNAVLDHIAATHLD